MSQGTGVSQGKGVQGGGGAARADLDVLVAQHRLQRLLDLVHAPVRDGPLFRVGGGHGVEEVALHLRREAIALGELPVLLVDLLDVEPQLLQPLGHMRDDVRTLDARVGLGVGDHLVGVW